MKCWSLKPSFGSHHLEMALRDLPWVATAAYPNLMYHVRHAQPGWGDLPVQLSLRTPFYTVLDLTIRQPVCQAQPAWSLWRSFCMCVAWADMLWPTSLAPQGASVFQNAIQNTSSSFSTLSVPVVVLPPRTFVFGSWRARHPFACAGCAHSCSPDERHCQTPCLLITCARLEAPQSRWGCNTAGWLRSQAAPV